jgi:hypothetical protein
VLLLTLRGTPVLYYGDELGMADGDVPPALARDPDGRDGRDGVYAYLREEGADRILVALAFTAEPADVTVPGGQRCCCPATRTAPGDCPPCAWARTRASSCACPPDRMGAMRTLEIDGVPASSKIGLGTWQFGSREWGYGEAYARREAGAMLRRALDLGVTFLDTAEIYAFGESERIIGEALAGRRDEAFLASKVVPVAAFAPVVEQRDRASLRRLGTDRLDLYQLYCWRERPDQHLYHGNMA